MTKKIIPLGVLLLAVFILSCNSGAQPFILKVVEFEKGIAQPDIQLLDVRTYEEFQSGHLANSLLADWNNPEEFKKRALTLDKSKPVFTYCLAGARSSAATEWLSNNGYTAYSLAGGINAWKKEGMPVEKSAIVQQLSIADFKANIPMHKTALIYIGALWCPPCKKMNPIIDSLANATGTQFVWIKLDGSQQTDICKALHVETFPTFIIYKNGSEAWRKHGVVTVTDLMENLQ